MRIFRLLMVTALIVFGLLLTPASSILAQGPTDEPPTAEPPTAEPPTAEPPTAEPPTAEPPTAEPPTAEPPTAEPPTAEPPTAEPPTAEPPTAEPPTAEPPTAEPPTAEPTTPPTVEPTTQPTVEPTQEPVVAAGDVSTSATPGNGTAWKTGFFITNKENVDASVILEFYREGNGTNQTPGLSKSVLANETKFFFLPGSEFSTLGSGEYSLVLKSGQAIVAVANATSVKTSGSGTNSTTSYDGVGSSDTAAKLFLPNVYSNFFGFYTNYYVQNASDAATTVNIKYFNPSGAEIASLAENGVPIPAGSFIKRDQVGVSALPANGVSSATIECQSAGCKLAGVVNIVNSNNAGLPANVGTANYVMFGQGGTTVNAPVVLNDFFNFNSSINVQNNGTGAVTVRITFSNGTVLNSTDPAPGIGGTLGAGQAWSVFLPQVPGLASGDSNGALAAKVEIVSPVAGNSIVALVNTSQAGNASFASYNGVLSGSQTIFASASNALAFSATADRGFFTSITCQNIGGSPTNLTYTFNGRVEKPSGGATVSGVSGTMSSISGAPATLAPGGSFVLLLNVASHRSALGLAEGFNGSTKITAGSDIACVVNQNFRVGPTTEDNLGSYTARP